MITPEQEKYNMGRNIRKFRMENHLTQEETVAELHARGIKMSRGRYERFYSQHVNRVWLYYAWQLYLMGSHPFIQFGGLPYRANHVKLIMWD